MHKYKHMVYNKPFSTYCEGSAPGINPGGGPRRYQSCILRCHQISGPHLALPGACCPSLVARVQPWMAFYSLPTVNFHKFSINGRKDEKFDTVGINWGKGHILAQKGSNLPRKETWGKLIHNCVNQVQPAFKPRPIGYSALCLRCGPPWTFVAPVLSL